LTSSERRLRLFMDTTLDGVIVLDESGRVIEFNPAAERLFGYTGDEIVGGSVNRLMPEVDAQRHNDYIRRVSTGDSRAMSSSREVMGLRKDGSLFPIEVTVAEARDGESLVHIGVVRDISERRAFEQQLLALATTDSLTGALNRRAFLEAGEDVFRRSVRYRHPLSVLAIDVDHFKRINDTFGHPIGDEVLIDLVSRIGENLRETDVFGRFGGEEFVVLLSEADEQRAIEVADRLLSVIRAADRVSMDGTPVRYTISIGIASAGEGGHGLNNVIHAADRALYNAKNAGRDRYRVAT
ncbi:MAG: diguanylate cyclase, partial [Gammaproteobacteria bacterium]|nr:diguanylate cyclase [Gammaproteobacteria bacterium]